MTSPPRPLSFGLVLAQLGSTECDASKSIGAGETAINYQGDDLCLCYDSSWVELRLSAMVCCY